MLLHVTVISIIEARLRNPRMVDGFQASVRKLNLELNTRELQTGVLISSDHTQLKSELVCD